jgi:hypothetical protein
MCWRVVLFLLSFPTSLQAQKGINLGFGFNNFKALSEFSDNTTRNPLGVSFLASKDLKNKRFQIGFELGVGLYSGKRYFYETVAEGYPGNYVNLYEENGFILYDVYLRYKLLKEKTLMPFVEAKAGASTYFSIIRSMQVSEVYEDDSYIHDTALNAGIGLGTYVDIGKLFTGKNWVKKTLLNISGNYLLGSQVRYRNAVAYEVVDTFESGFRESKTNTFQYHIGLVLAF